MLHCLHKCMMQWDGSLLGWQHVLSDGGGNFI